jgi:hypothetical protein
MKTLKTLLIIGCLFLAALACQMPGGPAAATEAPTETELPQPEPALTETATLEPAAELTVTTRTIVEEGEDPKFEVEVRYPHLEWGGDTRVEPFNAAVETLMQDEVRAFVEGIESTIEGPVFEDQFSSLNVDYEITNNEHGIFSTRLTVSYYMAGAAHPGYYTHTFTHDLVHGKLLALDELFMPGTAYLEEIARISIDDLRERDLLAWEEGAAPTPDNYRNWNVAPDALWITFDEYQVAPHAAGNITVEIPYEQLRDFIQPNGPLENFIN